MQKKIMKDFVFSTVFSLLLVFMLLYSTGSHAKLENIVFLSAWPAAFISFLGIYILQRGDIRRKAVR